MKRNRTIIWLPAALFLLPPAGPAQNEGDQQPRIILAGRQGGRVKLKRRGGSRLAEAIRLGLDWLERHQAPDGRLSARGFIDRCPAGDSCKGAARTSLDVEMTSLGLLAFLGDGSTPGKGPHQSAVKKAVLWLQKQESAKGAFGKDPRSNQAYTQSLGTLALLETYVLSKDQGLAPHVQNGVDFLLEQRNLNGVWGGAGTDRRGNSLATAMAASTLHMASQAGMRVAADCREDALRFLENLTNSETGECAYSLHPSEHALAKSKLMTPASLLGRIFLGQRPREVPGLLEAGRRLLEHPPRWGADYDVIHSYLGTYAAFQLGGRYWSRWRKHLERALLTSQIGAGHARGSWEPVGWWGERLGRLGSTALGVLSIQVYYRYTRIVR